MIGSEDERVNQDVGTPREGPRPWPCIHCGTPLDECGDPACCDLSDHPYPTLIEGATPRPWMAQSRDDGRSQPWYIDTHAYPTGPEPVVADGYPLNAADAALIVTAVNDYDRLRGIEEAGRALAMAGHRTANRAADDRVAPKWPDLLAERSVLGETLRRHREVIEAAFAPAAITVSCVSCGQPVVDRSDDPVIHVGCAMADDHVDPEMERIAASVLNGTGTGIGVEWRAVVSLRGPEMVGEPIPQDEQAAVVTAIEAEARSAALSAVEAAVGGLHRDVCLCPGDGTDPGCNAPNFYLDILAAIASLRDSVPIAPAVRRIGQAEATFAEATIAVQKGLLEDEGEAFVPAWVRDALNHWFRYPSVEAADDLRSAIAEWYRDSEEPDHD